MLCWRNGYRAMGIFLSLMGMCVSPRASAEEAAIVFNRDIRPLLSENCFHCHGPDSHERQAGLRLDERDDAIDFGAIVPGSAEESEFIRRIESHDGDELMPPPGSHKRLSDEQKSLLRRWVDQGAPYQRHWAYEPPVRPEVPADEHPVDYFVRQSLAKAGVSPSPEADRRTLARRLWFDLVGLPPTPEEVEAFVRDPSPDAYEQLVERLLSSPHYGERMALGWLDVVRYADSVGYHADPSRNVWPYRDYVIESFNENKRFDQFTVEQLAGDLLPNSGREQKIGSAFNRLLLTTEEGGAQVKDYEARMLADRVRAVGTVWLGQTLGCCQCHDHKFDPATLRDFYSMGAFFADIEEATITPQGPGEMFPSPEQVAQLDELRERIHQAREEYDAAAAGSAEAQLAWEKSVGEKPGSTDPQIVELVGIDRAKRTPEQQARLRDHFQSQIPELVELRSKLEAAERELYELDADLPRCLVTNSTPTPRIVRVLPRGDWMDETGEVVTPAVPHYLPQIELKEDRRLNRLDLARWIVAQENPLTARVFVNRLWKQFFGMGISKSVGDFGAQGEWPVHPELLDWMACEFVDSGWDVKHMVRTIVTSRTYRQASVASPEMLERDPENRLLARQSRFRLEAELVRDNALAISGLLALEIGGPSVKPYQPDGYWDYLNFPIRTYVHDTGADQYRRGLYTWWQRTFLHPSLLAFDAPTREECVPDRTRSNIPQQALVLLNDPTYVEAAREFAKRIMTQGGDDTSARIDWAWRQALSRPPRDDEQAIAAALYEKHYAELSSDPTAVDELLEVGLAPTPEDLDRTELAAWMSVARMILNLHETIVRD